MPPQPVDATPSAINLFSKGGVYDATETGEAFLGTKDRPVYQAVRKSKRKRLLILVGLHRLFQRAPASLLACHNAL